MLTTSHVVTKIINLGLVVLLTRLLGREGFGVYSFSFLFTGMFMFLVNLGINSLLVRDIARHKAGAQRLVSTATPAVLILSLLTVVTVNSIALLSGWTPLEKTAIFIFSFYLLFDGWSRFLISVFRAFEKMEYEALVNLTERIALLLSAVLAWLFHLSLIQLIILFSGVELLKAVFAFVLVHRKFVPIRLRFHFPQMYTLLKESFPFALMGIFGTISMRIDIVMIRMFYSSDAVGVYNVARRLVESLTFIPENIVIAFFPAISVLYLHNRPKFNRTFQQALQSMLVIAIPFSIGLFLLARPIIQFLFEPEYLAAYRPLQWFGLWLGVLFMKHIFATTLNAIGRQALFSRLAGLSMVLNAGLNYVLIPLYQIEGASLATLFSEAITALIAFWAVRKYLNLPQWSSFYPKLAGVLMLLAGAGFFLRNSNLLLAVGLIGLIYLILLFLFHIVTLNQITEWVNRLKPQTSEPKD